MNDITKKFKKKQNKTHYMAEKTFKGINALLIDIDGTLYFKDSPIPGAISTISELRNAGYKLLFLTNTDSKLPKTILKILQNHGFSIYEKEIFTPITALKKFLSEYSDKKLYLVTTREVETEFQEFSIVKGSEIPDFVVIGDFRDNWDVNRLNSAFKYVLKGAKLFGTQGNRYFLDREANPVLDTGSFTYLIANAAKVTPRIFGKPSKDFFSQALNKINSNINEAIVIGDDIESDIQGATNAGIRSVLVKTGKGQFVKNSDLQVKPFMIIDSISSILENLF